MSTLTPFNSVVPTKPLKYVAALRGEKVDSVPIDGEYIGLEQIESGTGRLSDVELQQQPEGAANVFGPGDVLFGKLRPYLAKGWAADRAGYCTTEALVLQPQSADSRFVRYCVLASEFIEAVNGSTYGSKMPRADWSFVGSVQVPFPARSHQERIANFLDEQTARIDALIAEKALLLERLQELHRSTLWKQVTKGVQGAPMQFRGVEWIGDCPSHWKVKAIKWLTPVLRGASPRPIDDPKYFDVDGEYGWVRIADVSASNGLLMTTEQQLSALGSSLSVKREPGDLFLSIAGTVGKPCIAGIKCCIHDGFVWFPSVGHGLLRDWLFAIFESGFAYAGLGKMGTQLNLNTDTVGSIRIPMPPEAEMAQILEQLAAAKAANHGLRNHVEAHIARLREYRSSLISAAVTGQLDMSTFKAAA